MSGALCGAECDGYHYVYRRHNKVIYIIASVVLDGDRRAAYVDCRHLIACIRRGLEKYRPSCFEADSFNVIAEVNRSLPSGRRRYVKRSRFRSIRGKRRDHLHVTVRHVKLINRIAPLFFTS